MQRTIPGSASPAAGINAAGGGAERSPAVARIIAQFRASLGELRCVGSERLVRHGVSMSHLHLMSMLDRHGELPMSRVAELLGVSDSNATGLIDRMEERGFVERVRHPDDRRVVLVRVTQAGSQILADVEVLKDDLIVMILSRLEPDRLTRVAEALEDVRGAIESIAAEQPDLFGHTHPHPHEPRPAAPAQPAAHN
ncbi:MAG TPA: MarR family transcriptional regulator [Candidatus Limnocylindrales bacterium]|jgi:DNA-binding MarR family transcriptional regulator